MSSLHAGCPEMQLFLKQMRSPSLHYIVLFSALPKVFHSHLIATLNRELHLWTN